jgi:D-3-phosphoglycerate dehydrogenase/C-terminal binding protein
MSDLPRVVLADFVTDSLEPERRILGEVASVTALNAYSEAELAGRIDDAAAIMLFHNVSLTAETISRLRACRVIVRCGVGFDNVDRALARACGIPVCNVPDYGTEEVADSAIGMLLSLTRGIVYSNTLLRDPTREWTHVPTKPLYRLRGRTFGIVGLGRIGTATALRAKALGMKVLFYDPYKQDGYDKSLGASRVEALDDLLRQSHALSLHCPLTDETRNMIDAAAIAKLPHGAYLINTSRGKVVDTAAVPPA